MNNLNPERLSVRPFARVGVPDALPGHCVRCPRNTDLVDLGAPGIQGFGVVYICTVCLGDLMTQMKVIGFEQHQAVIDAARAREAELQNKLADAIEASAAPINYIQDALIGFSNDLDRSARDLIARVRSYRPAGDPGRDRVAAVAVEPDEPRAADVRDDVRGAVPAEPERVVEPAAGSAPVAADDDAGDRLVAALLGVESAPRAPQPADAGRDDDADDVDEPGDGLSLLYGEAAG